MTIPAEVLVLGQRWSVELTADALHDGAQLGRSSLAQQRIVVNAAQHAEQLQDTVLHEVIHACIISLGGGHHERLVGMLTPVLLDVLRSNPDLVAYLTRRIGATS